MIKDILIYYSVPLILLNICITLIAKYDAIKDGIICSKLDKAAQTGVADPLKDLWHLVERFKEITLIIFGVFIGLAIGVFWFRGFLFSPVLMFAVGISVTLLNIYFSHYYIWNDTFAKRNHYLEKEDTWNFPIVFPKWLKWLEKFLGFHH